MAQQALPMQRGHDATAGAMQQRLVQRLLELLDLHAHRGLRAADPGRSLAERARLRNRHEGAQQVDVEMAAQGMAFPGCAIFVPIRSDCNHSGL